jgi:hypothetical protein
MLAGMSAIGMGTVVGSLMGAGSTNIDGAEKILDVEEEVTDAIRHGQWVIIVHSRTSADAERAQTLLPNRRIVREDKPGTAALSDFAAEQVDIRKLGGIVEEAFESVAKESTLPAQEVLCNIEDIDVAPLKQAVTKAMKNIADATNLHTAQITGVFRANRVASVNDIVNRLHEQSKANRSTF